MCLALVLLKHEVDEPATLHAVKGAAWMRSQFCQPAPSSSQLCSSEWMQAAAGLYCCG